MAQPNSSSVPSAHRIGGILLVDPGSGDSQVRHTPAGSRSSISQDLHPCSPTLRLINAQSTFLSFIYLLPDAHPHSLHQDLIISPNCESSVSMNDCFKSLKSSHLMVPLPNVDLEIHTHLKSQSCFPVTISTWHTCQVIKSTKLYLTMHMRQLLHANRLFLKHEDGDASCKVDAVDATKYISCVSRS